MSTICAIATPPGAGGIGIVRISGPDSGRILHDMFLPRSRAFNDFIPWRMYRGTVLDASRDALDDALAVFMPGPATFTGEDVAEIHCHGGPLLVRTVLDSALARGARPAQRGEFTRRAFLNGRMDLSQAEAVAEIISAPSREALRYGLRRLEGLLAREVSSLAEQLADLRALASVAVDFPDDEIPPLDAGQFVSSVREVSATAKKLLSGARRSSLMQNGARVLLSGRVNSGKSSLLNALLGRERALVTELPGTTRDFIEESVDIDGLPVRLVDTAGLRINADPADMVEELGIARSMALLADADAVMLVLDGSRGRLNCVEPEKAEAEILKMAGATPMLLVWNKCDLAAPDVFPPPWADGRPGVVVSAKNGENIDYLAAELRKLILADASQGIPDGDIAPNARQAEALEKSIAELDALEMDVAAGQSYDCCLARLDTAAAHLADITGVTGHDELLDRIFSRFCIGK